MALPRFLVQLLWAGTSAATRHGGYVFTSTEGDPVRHRNFMRRHFAPAVIETGFGGLRWHDLGHTCAAMLVTPGHSLYEIKEQLGHSFDPRHCGPATGICTRRARAAMAASLDALYSTSRVKTASPRQLVRLPDASQAP